MHPFAPGGAHQLELSPAGKEQAHSHLTVSSKVDMESTRTTHTRVPSASGRHSGGYGAGAFTVSSLAFSSGGSMAGLQRVSLHTGKQGFGHACCVRSAR